MSAYQAQREKFIRDFKAQLRHPKEVHEEAVQKAMAQYGMTSEEAEGLFLEDSNKPSAYEAFRYYIEDTPFINTADVYEAFERNPGQYSNWRCRLKLAKKISAAEAAWLLHYAENNSRERDKPKHATSNLINPRHPKLDPLKEIRMRTAESKVGRVVGKWRLLKCLSDSEVTSNNAKVMYDCVCVDCGQPATINYRFAAGKSCPQCSGRNRKPSLLPEEAKGRHLVIYMTDEGTVKMMKHGKVPHNAVKKCVLSHYGLDLPWIKIRDDEPREQNEAAKLAAKIAEKKAEVEPPLPQIVRHIADEEAEEHPLSKNFEIPDFD